VALRYQHATVERDRVLADAVGEIAEAGREREVYTLRNGTPVPLLSDAYEVAC
jgi:hypothetical protein